MESTKMCMNKGIMITTSSRRKYLTVSIAALFFLMAFTAGCEKTKKEENTAKEGYSSHRQKVLYVDSYHRKAPWSAGILTGIESTFRTKKNIELKTIHLNTKRNPSEDFKKEAALRAKDIIEAWQPDIVITSDDNAAKYLIVPYYKGSNLPFVFCGINWDASVYGLPCKNVTGMVEVSLVKEFIKHIAPFARGKKIAFLAPDTTSTHQVLAQHKKILEILPSNIKFVTTLQEWKEAYLGMQTSADLLLMAVWAGIADWNEPQVLDFIHTHTKIPSGSFYGDVARYSLACFANDPKEQGEWAAATALEILGGKSPDQIPVVTNKRARIFLNMPLAKKLNIIFPVELMERAEYVE